MATKAKKDAPKKEVTKLDDFKKRLKEGVFAGRTGAMRSIGRMQGLSDDERKKGRQAVERHYAKG